MCLLFPSALAAQSAAADAYSKEPFVIERADVMYRMNADGTGFMQKTVMIKLQSESALQQVGIVGMAFAANSQRVEFHYVRVRRPDGSVTETPLTGVMDQPLPATVQAPFYSDLKVAQLPVKNLQVGDTLEWEARVVLTRAEAANEFWGAETLVTEDSVVREESVELRAPASKAVTVWTNPALGIKVKQSKDGDETVYRWETAALKPTVGPEADAARAAKKKHVLTADEEMDEERGKLPSVAWTTFPSWAAVGEWYRGLELSRATPDDEIKAKVKELTAGKTTDEEKVRALYEYVSTQVRYIGVAFGVGRYQPHEAVEVLHNQYGDCKDKATLLSAMLAAAGIPSDAALIGAGVRFNEAIPSPASFNHLITHLKIKGQDVWLDATEEVAPYRMMYAVLRDREALVVPATGAPVIARTPKDLPFSATQVWTAKGALDANGTSESQISIRTRGDDELMMRAAVRQIGPGQWDEFTQRLLGAIGYAGTESHATFSRPEDVDQPFEMSFSYHREKAGDWDNLKIIPQLAPSLLPAVDEKDPPKSALNLGTPRTESSTAELKLPAGWTAELPEAVHEKSAYATYDLTYRLEKGTLYSERKIVVLESKVPVSEWKSYKKFADAVGVGNETYVQLRRVGAQTAAAEKSSTTDSSTEVPGQATTDTDRIEEAAADAHQMKLDKAEQLLAEVKLHNDKQAGLWDTYGLVAMMRGKANEAAEDFHKEITLYPGSTAALRDLLHVQLSRGDREGAIATLRQWETFETPDAKNEALLASLLYGKKRYGEAEVAARRALSILPKGQPDTPLKLVMGEAEVRDGHPELGVPILEELLRTSKDPGVINEAAYVLADTKHSLALAQEKVRIVLDQMEAESQGWTLSSTAIQQKESLMVATWDTYGWILFRQNHLQEAKSFIEASYVVLRHQEVEAHLAAVNAALNLHSPIMGNEEVRHVGKSVVLVRTSPGALNAGSSKTTGAVGAQFRVLLAQGQMEGAEPAAPGTLDNGMALLARTNFTSATPKGSTAHLVVTALINCFAGRCELVLEP